MGEEGEEARGARGRRLRRAVMRAVCSIRVGVRVRFAWG